MNMGTQGSGRKRLPNRERLTAEDDALNQIAREVSEARPQLSASPAVPSRPQPSPVVPSGRALGRAPGALGPGFHPRPADYSAPATRRWRYCLQLQTLVLVSR